MKHEELRSLIVITHTIACLLLNLTKLLHLFSKINIARLYCVTCVLSRGARAKSCRVIDDFFVCDDTLIAHFFSKAMLRLSNG